MEQQQIPETNFQKFMKTKPAMLIGALISIGIGILMMWLGLFQQCCNLGYLLIACVALYVPKMFGMTKTQYLAVFGVVFFLVLTVMGAMVFSKPMFENESNVDGYSSDGFSNVTITEVGDGVQISVTYTGEAADKLNVNLYQVKMVTYTMINKTSHDDACRELAKVGETTTYTVTYNDVPKGFIYQLSFETVKGEDTNTSASVYYLGRATDSDISSFCWMGNGYTCAWMAVIFFIMLILTTVMRKNLEKTRARMEAEGRLYPQGYGRCKECGSIVLPGETCCRKCGAFIEVPDELRHKKVDMVECSECGAEIPEDAKVCPKCGAVFDEEEEIVYVDSEAKITDVPEDKSEEVSDEKNEEEKP